MTTAATPTEHGDRAIAMAGDVLRSVVGSGVHGIAILQVKRGDVTELADVLQEIDELQV